MCSKVKKTNNYQMKSALVNKGFTVIELMIAVALLVVIISIAVPSYSDFIERQQIKSKTNRLLTIFTGARSEAMVSGGSVICWTPAGAKANGKEVVVSANTLVSMVDDTPDDATDKFSVLSEFDYSGRLTVNFSGDDGSDGCVAFSAQGRLLNGGNSFLTTLCRASGDYDNAQVVEIAISGRSSVQEATAGC